MLSGIVEYLKFEGTQKDHKVQHCSSQGYVMLLLDEIL